MYLSIAHFNLGCHQIFSDSFGPRRLRVNLALASARYSLRYFMLHDTSRSPRMGPFALTSKQTATAQ